MSATSSLALYPIADTFQVSLFFKDGVPKAHVQRPLKIGPWSMKTDLMVHCLSYNLSQSETIVKVRKDMWLYVTYDCTTHRMMMVVFKKPEGLKSAEIGKFFGKDVLAQIRPYVKAVFTSKAKEGWTRAEIAVVDEGLAGQSAESPPAGAAN